MGFFKDFLEEIGNVLRPWIKWAKPIFVANATISVVAGYLSVIFAGTAIAYLWPISLAFLGCSTLVLIAHRVYEKRTKNIEQSRALASKILGLPIKKTQHYGNKDKKININVFSKIKKWFGISSGEETRDAIVPAAQAADAVPLDTSNQVGDAYINALTEDEKQAILERVTNIGDVSQMSTELLTILAVGYASTSMFGSGPAGLMAAVAGCAVIVPLADQVRTMLTDKAQEKIISILAWKKTRERVAVNKLLGQIKQDTIYNSLSEKQKKQLKEDSTNIVENIKTVSSTLGVGIMAVISAYSAILSGANMQAIALVSTAGAVGGYFAGQALGSEAFLALLENQTIQGIVKNYLLAKARVETVWEKKADTIVGNYYLLSNQEKESIKQQAKKIYEQKENEAIKVKSGIGAAGGAGAAVLSGGGVAVAAGAAVAGAAFGAALNEYLRTTKTDEQIEKEMNDCIKQAVNQVAPNYHERFSPKIEEKLSLWPRKLAMQSVLESVSSGVGHVLTSAVNWFSRGTGSREAAKKSFIDEINAEYRKMVRDNDGVTGDDFKTTAPAHDCDEDGDEFFDSRSMPDSYDMTDASATTGLAAEKKTALQDVKQEADQFVEFYTRAGLFSYTLIAEKNDFYIIENDKQSKKIVYKKALKEITAFSDAGSNWTWAVKDYIDNDNVEKKRERKREILQQLAPDKNIDEIFTEKTPIVLESDKYIVEYTNKEGKKEYIMLLWNQELHDFNVYRKIKDSGDDWKLSIADSNIPYSLMEMLVLSMDSAHQEFSVASVVDGSLDPLIAPRGMLMPGVSLEEQQPALRPRYPTIGDVD